MQRITISHLSTEGVFTQVIGYIKRWHDDLPPEEEIKFEYFIGDIPDNGFTLVIKIKSDVSGIMRGDWEDFYHDETPGSFREALKDFISRIERPQYRKPKPLYMDFSIVTIWEQTTCLITVTSNQK